MTDDLDGEGAEFVVFAVGECLRRSNHDALTRMDAQWVKVLHVADGDAVVETVTHHFIFNFLPTLQRFLHQHLRREGEGLLCQLVQFLLIVAETGTQTSECISSADDDGIAKVGSCFPCFFNRFTGVALDGFHVNLVQFLHEEFAVFCVNDCLNGRAKHLYVIFLQNLLLIESHTAVQCSLSTKCQEDALRLFLLDDLFYKKRCHGQEINLVGNTLGSLHRGNIGIDEHRFDALFLQCFQSLAA